MKKNKKIIPPEEKSTEEIISSANTDLPPSTDDQLLIHHSQLITNNMEVHHHSHVHETKKWKEYFFQFLMLFLAVFCGFLAEYQLEHVIENNREKQFIQSYIEDLKTDTASIRTAIEFRKMKMMQMDSLMVLLKNQTIKGHENELYFFGRSLVRNLTFQSNDRTITQLKNSGSLRMIRNVRAADSMMSYQKLVEIIVINHNDDRTERYNAFPLISRMFNPFVFDKMLSASGISRPEGNPSLRSYDPSIQQDLAFYINQIKGSTFLIESRLEILNTKGKDLIALLKKEYHIY